MRQTQITPHFRELWDSKAMLLLIVVLLGCEWILRKRANMA